MFCQISIVMLFIKILRRYIRLVINFPNLNSSQKLDSRSYESDYFYFTKLKHVTNAHDLSREIYKIVSLRKQKKCQENSKRNEKDRPLLAA